jgi:hypothetical protein
VEGFDQRRKEQAHREGAAAHDEEQRYGRLMTTIAAWRRLLVIELTPIRRGS